MVVFFAHALVRRIGLACGVLASIPGTPGAEHTTLSNYTQTALTVVHCAYKAQS